MKSSTILAGAVTLAILGLGCSGGGDVDTPPGEAATGGTGGIAAEDSGPEAGGAGGGTAGSNQGGGGTGGSTPDGGGTGGSTPDGGGTGGSTPDGGGTGGSTPDGGGTGGSTPDGGGAGGSTPDGGGTGGSTPDGGGTGGSTPDGGGTGGSTPDGGGTGGSTPDGGGTGGSGGCQDTCSGSGVTQCIGGQLQTCTADGTGCLAWGTAVACPQGFCKDAESCGSCANECPAASATQCIAGKLQTCEVDGNGCRAWGTESACAEGFCKDAQSCGTNVDECKLGTAQCPAHSTCVDTPGSYLCTCDCGYYHDTPTTCADQFPNVLFVDDNGPVNGNGDCWSRAYPSLQQAIAAAKPGDELWVAQGTYKPGTAPQDSFVIPAQVSIYGGFAGTETDKVQRGDPALHKSILSGAIGAIRSHHIMTATSAVQADSAIDGLVFDNGNATPSADGIGGGLLVKGGSPVVRSCAFTNNGGTSGGAVGIDGGQPSIISCRFQGNISNLGACAYLKNAGQAFISKSTFENLSQCVALDAGTTVTVEDSSFKGSQAAWGGAIRAVDAVVSIARTTFTQNQASYDGGALYALRCSLALKDAIFTGNTAWDNGGCIWSSEGTIAVDGCTFQGSTAASDSGGAIYVGASKGGAIENSSFTGGSASYGGGAIYLRSSPLVAIQGCTFQTNKSNTTGGAIYLQFNQSTRITGSTFDSNTSSWGGAVYVQTGDLTLVRATFRGNSAKAGGAVQLLGNDLGFSRLDVVNALFEGNLATVGSGGALDVSDSHVAIFNTHFSGNRAGTTSSSVNATGGALNFYDCETASIVNSSFSANQSPGGGAVGASQYSVASTVTLTNDVFWGNTPAGYGTTGLAFQVSRSCVQEFATGAGNVLLATSPFVDADGADDQSGTADDDLHLLASACVNAGDASAVPADTYDLNGNGNTSEPVSIDLGGGARVLSGQIDMGAYESGY